GAGRVESESITVTVAQPASIVSQPEGGQAALGDAFVLTVAATGTEPLSYQWYHDGELIFGAGLANLTLADLGAVDSGTYQVVIQNLAGTATSDTVTLSVESPPEITQQPASRDAAVGSDIVLNVLAIGSEPLAYQWSRDGVVLPGATGAELTLTGIVPSDAGSYTVSISNFAGLLASDVAVINVIHPIAIAEQPSGGSKVLGETVTVAVAVTGSEPITYQWMRNGTVLAGANDASIVLENLSAADAGEYTVRVSNPAGEVLSDVAVVSVDSPPEMVELSGDQSAPVGGNVELAVVAAGNEPLSYQWVKDGVLMEGATSASLILANLDTTDSGSYTVVVTNSAGRLESDPIVVSVIQPVSIVLQPESATAAIGGKAVFEVAVTGSAPVSYQWKLNGESLPSQTAAKLVIEEVAAVDGGTYTVTASNASNSVESDGAELTIQTPPIITKIAGNQQAAVGDTVTLWVTAVGTPPLSYQWKREGVVIPGGTGATLELADLVSLDAGQYTVEISNSAGSTVSDPIEVSVAAAPQIVSQPASRNIGLNARLILTVSATGSGLGYQWYRDGQVIEGAIEAVMTVPNAGSADSGIYHVTVSNTVGSATSETAEVVVVAAPDILAQPEGGFAPLGGEFVMSVEAKGAGEVAYQWRVDGVVLEGRTQNVLNLTELKLSDAGVYAVEVVNAAGITKSEEAEVQVLIPVSVIEHPQDQSVVAGSLVLFEAVIAGSNPIAYQWYFNGNPVEAAIEASLRVENASNEHLGGYHVVASNPVSTVTSEAGTLVVNLPPAVASHPAGGTVTKGDDTTFVVEATGTGPFTYKWQRDGEEIAGATGPVLTLTKVDAGDDALYTVLIENPYGIVVSDPAELEVILPVSITGQPVDTHVALDGMLALSVTATGTGPFEYQWYRGDDKIEGAVEAEMQIPNMTRKKDGLYRVEVKNLLGAMFSREAEVVVDEPVSITVQPSGATLLQGEEAVMWVLAKGSEPLSYQWQKDGVALEGQTETSLTLSDAVEADEGNYSVIITNPVGFEVSAEALVKVNSPPTIEPIDPVIVSAGDALQVQVVADDADGDISKLRYVLRNQPAGMKISPSGLVEWSVGSEAEAKAHTVSIIVIDQSMLAASGKLTIRVNATPGWLDIAPQTVVAGRELLFKPVLVDPDDTEWSYSTGELPVGASYDPEQGFNWTPGLAQVGTHEVALTATDSHGASGTALVNIDVKANAAPAITPLDPVVVSRGGQLSVRVSADDPDGDNANLKYELQDAPVGMTISAEGLIEWTVSANAPGGSLEVKVVALDELSPSPAAILAVTVNLPPVLTAVAPQTVQAGQALVIKTSAVDPEGAEVVFSARDLPDGAGFDASSGFNWTPTTEQLGVHEVVFAVKDPHGASDEETVIITVTLKPNAAPTLEALEPAVVTRGDTLSVQVVADDPDGDNAKLKYQLQDAPAGMTVSGTGLIEWPTGPETAAGTTEVAVIVVDELESRASGTLAVTVNLPPVLDAIGPQTVEAGQALAIKPSATDPNDTDLVYTATDLPAGAVFDAETGFRWTPAEDQVGVHEVTFAVSDPHGAKVSVTVAITVTKAPAFVLLSSATVVGEFAEESGATLDEDSKTFTVKRSGGMRFYRLRTTGEAKPRITSIRLEDDNAVIAYEVGEE
ncbi:MAG: immunoglobulin domain-containing protein, partial [Verrucomicrobia bacterium]|nr:immunoglobulin domain-containing protein [Verrucomicrobiota bacterium]